MKDREVCVCNKKILRTSTIPFSSFIPHSAPRKRGPTTNSHVEPRFEVKFALSLPYSDACDHASLSLPLARRSGTPVIIDSKGQLRDTAWPYVRTYGWKGQ
jgi:hypothetical protein